MLYLFTNYKKNDSEAERFNGWAAMLGFVAAVGAYVTTGQIIQVGFNENNESKIVEEKLRSYGRFAMLGLLL